MLDTPAGRRRVIIDIARRRVRPGSGSSREFLRTRTWSDPIMTLDLNVLTVPYVVVGGVATALYMPQRVTYDIDILVHADDAGRLGDELRAAGCAEIGPLAFGGRHWRTPDGDELDVLESGEPWALDAVGAPNRSPTGLPVIALPYLILMKMDASRAQDVADVSRMLGAANEDDRHQVREVIRRHRPDQSDDIESLIALGDLEYQDG
jgi:hypothetical protein